MATQEVASTFLVHFEGGAPAAKELKDALEKGDIPTKIATMKTVIMLQLNGEPQTHLIMSVIKHCVPVEDHMLKKLTIYFWECVDKADENGDQLPEIILMCANLRSDLQHPNEYVRGVTLRFLCKVREKEVLEPLVSSVAANLTHTVPYVRRNAITAVHAIFSKFPDLLPDSPELVENVLLEETDASARRHAFIMLFQCAQDRAVRCLINIRDGDPTAEGDVFLLACVDLIKQLIQANPFEKNKYVPLIFAILNSKNPAVLFQCASTLLALSSSPTAIKQAISTLVQLLTTHSDNNVRFVVLDRLNDMKSRFRNVLQESLMDILRGLSTGNSEVRERILDLCGDLVTPKNIESFIVFMKKELVRSQSEDVGDHDAQQKYRQQLVRIIHNSVLTHMEFAPIVVPVMLDHICESGASAQDVALFIREVMQHRPELHADVLQQLANNFQLITSPKVFRTVLWLFGVHCKTSEQIASVVKQVKEAIQPFPLAPVTGSHVDPNSANADDGPSTVTTTTVREDGTYVMNIELVNKRTETERSDLAGLRALIVGGDFFLAAALANTLSKLVVQLYQLKDAQAQAIHTGVQSDCIDIMREIIRYGASPNAAAPLDNDTHERLRHAMTVTQNPRNAFLQSIVKDSLNAFDVTLKTGRALEDATSAKRNAKKEAAANAVVEMGDIDAPLSYTQLSRGRAALMDFQATNDDVGVALANETVDKNDDFVSRLQRVVQLSGFSDPVYAEATVTVHQFDIMVELFLVNQTDDMLSNVTVELTTMGDLKLCERPQTYHMPAGSQVSTKATIKVSSTETGMIHGTVVFDRNDQEGQCVILNEISVDIMDYIHPSTCSAAQFRNMWTEFEWENKVVVNTDIRDLAQFVEAVITQTNMKSLDFQPTTGDCGFLNTSLYARSSFGEDALANVSLEQGEDGRVEGVVRVRSKTQGIALGLGDKVQMKLKAPPVVAVAAPAAASGQ